MKSTRDQVLKTYISKDHAKRMETRTTANVGFINPSGLLKQVTSTSRSAASMKFAVASRDKMNRQYVSKEQQAKLPQHTTAHASMHYEPFDTIRLESRHRSGQSMSFGTGRRFGRSAPYISPGMLVK